MRAHIHYLSLCEPQRWVHPWRSIQRKEPGGELVLLPPPPLPSPRPMESLTRQVPREGMVRPGCLDILKAWPQPGLEELWVPHEPSEVMAESHSLRSGKRRVRIDSVSLARSGLALQFLAQGHQT